MILAQNASVVDDDSNSLIDQYVSRYVNTLSTPYLQRDPNCTLIQQVDFDSYAGLSAVNATIRRQRQYMPGDDPYESQFESCSNGNVQPILPRFSFGFTNSSLENIQIKVDYKILTMPGKKDTEYNLLPSLQKRFNHKDGAFHISGPYCYGDDPKRAYSFDFSFTSAHPNADISLFKGCVEGLPCLPPAAMIGDLNHIIVYNHTQTGEPAVADMTQAFLSVACYFLLLILAISLTCNCQLSGKLKRMQDLHDHETTRQMPRHPPARVFRPAPTTAEAINPYGDLGGGGAEESKEANDEPDEPNESMSQPLLRPNATVAPKTENKGDSITVDKQDKNAEKTTHEVV